MAKMQPFWWFLPPPSVTYWENRCEEYPGEWTGNLDYWSLSTTRKEGNYSLRGYTNTMAGLLIHKPVSNVTQNEYWFLKWCRIDNLRVSGDVLAYLKAGAHVWGFDMVEAPSPGYNKWRLCARIDSGVGVGVSGYVYEWGVWYALRMRVRRNYPIVGRSRIDVYVGLTLEAWNECDFLLPNPSQVELNLNTVPIVIYSDWLRVKDVGW